MYRDDIGGSTGYKAQRSPSPEHAEDVQHDRRTCVTWESGVRETFRCGVTDRQPYPTTVIGVSRALRAIPKLSEFLNANVVRSSAGIAPEHLAAVLAWGTQAQCEGRRALGAGKGPSRLASGRWISALRKTRSGRPAMFPDDRRPRHILRCDWSLTPGVIHQCPPRRRTDTEGIETRG